VFLHPMGSMGHVVHSGAFGARNIDTLLFMLRWDRYGFDRKSVETRYAALVFLYPVGHTGHVVHSGAPERETSMHYFSCSGGTAAFSIKKHDGTHYVELVFLHPVGSAGQVVHSGVFGARILDVLYFMPGWAGTDLTKSAS
jgi:hypothetical protein